MAVVYFTCIQNMKLVTKKFKSGGLHEKHVMATWNLGKATWNLAYVSLILYRRARDYMTQ